MKARVLLLLLACLNCGAAGSADTRLPPLDSDGRAKVEHYVLILMENRPHDHTFGCMQGEGIIDGDGINGSHAIPTFDPDGKVNGSVTVSCGTAKYVCANGPPNNMWALQADPKANISYFPYHGFNNGSDHSHQNGARDNALEMFNSTQLPIKTAIVSAPSPG